MIYLDTSAAVPMFVPEPASDAVDAWFEFCDEALISSGLRSGDSLHLSMALEVGAVGVATADANLEKNARSIGLAVNRF